MNNTLFESDLQLRFEEFDRDNPKVWKAFVDFANRAIKKGFEHYGAKTIFEAIRWHTDIVTTDAEFKINNDYTAYYARKFHEAFPEHDGFFRLRKVRG